MLSLYDRVGPDRIRRIVQIFYEKCLTDPMLAHLFMNADHSHLVEMQLTFISNLLGGPKVYEGKPLTAAHARLSIRPPHFQRRQRILAETMAEEGLEPELANAWLSLEERLRPLIMNDSASCQN